MSNLKTRVISDLTEEEVEEHRDLIKLVTEQIQLHDEVDEALCARFATNAEKLSIERRTEMYITVCLNIAARIGHHLGDNVGHSVGVGMTSGTSMTRVGERLLEAVKDSYTEALTDSLERVAKSTMGAKEQDLSPDRVIN